MSLLPDFHDPLAICLKHQVSVFLSNTPLGLPHVSSLHPSSSRGEILRVLSQLLLVPSITSAVARAFRPLLLDLCARWLENEECIEEKLVSLCFLLQPHVEIYPILSAFLQQHIPQNGPLAFVLASSSLQSLDTSRLQRVLLAYYRILHANRELPEHLSWSLEPLSKLLWAPHPDPGVRYLAVRCYSLQSRMGEAEREKLEKELVGSDSDIDCPVEFGEDADGQRRLVDGWLLPIIEAKRVHEARSTIASDQQNFFEGPEESRIELSELSKFVTSVHGILMFSRPIPGRISTPLIPTPTSVQALRALALHVSLRLPVLLTSPPSSGKSLLLSHLAAALHPEVKNQIITIGLADTSLDPRSLLGSYVSSPTSPGTFEWKEGILVRALRMGRWVVFEDIDRGSNEVLGTIKPLIESLGADKWVGGRAKMQIPSRGEVVAAESFMIFATRSPMPPSNGVFAKPSFFGAHKFHEVTFATPTTEELRTIFVAKFARLSHAAVESLIRLWDAIRALGSAASSRDVGLRELEKYCRRVEGLLPASYQPMNIDIPTNVDQGADSALAVVFSNPTLREDMYIEARDVFFGSGTLTAAARAHADAVAAVVAEHLSLSQEQCEWVLRGRVPEFDNERDVNGRTTALRIGRIRLPARASKMEISPPATRPFALHRPAVLLMSRIATAISLCEPVLLTGETGTGKTSVVTHMATALRRPLISLNLSQQTESSDLIGGFKPVDARVPGSELQERFLELFRTTFSQKKNAKFEESVLKAVQEVKWKRAVGLWKESARLAKERIQGKLKEMTAAGASQDELDSDAPRKRRRTEQVDLTTSEANWTAFEQAVHQFELQHVKGKGKFAFSFVEGPLVKALRTGDWVLLDEINLASPETLEAISSLLHGPTASITLTEQGSLEPVPRHPDFRLFACMNPATDVGKKDLPPNIRSHFTEIDVPPPDADRDTLLAIVTQYIGPSAVGDKAAIMDVAEFYTAVKQLAEDRKIADGANHKPHFSMRTLARALTFAADIASSYSLRRAMWEGCLMAFTMVLDAGSAELVTALAQKHILSGVRNPRALLTRDPAPPQLRPEDFRGHLPEDSTDDYIMTPSVEKKLIDLARIIITRRFPTSSIEYLAKRTGHRFEYLGTYVSDPVTGKLVNGDWIVLDELNLAPTDLVIPETQEVNPPGLYAGRKILSRAFRNRFLEVHFDDRCRIAPSYAQRIVASSRVFESKHGFATLHANGYMLLAERARREDDKVVVKEIIESIMKVRIDESALYDFSRIGGDFATQLGFDIPSSTSLRLLVLPVLLTSVCQRLYAVNCHQNTETADLIGGLRPMRNRNALEAEILQEATSLLAQHGVSDGLEKLIPALAEQLQRLGAIFEWHDGPLVEAMRQGDVLLLDEISLADDSVLELLAEKGGDDVIDAQLKELSPALRNRFTEIWVPSIVVHSWRHECLKISRTSERSLFGLRDILHHAARMTCIDGLGSFPQLNALSKLHDIAPVTPEESAYVPSHHSSHFVQLGSMHTYNIQAPTTRDNAMRVPILLEGSPGVGKTSLITALANICGYHLCRINLSDQTDLADLFGSDLPDAEFLKAMQEGHWVLLDEMNLAPQSVLEGLNAVLDHRGSVYVPELGRSFSRHPAFRIFAAQNPIQQGGGRKGLPKSYVNRFTKVYIDPLTPSDLLQITRHLFPHYPAELLQKEEVTVKRAFGRAGSPWEFNLRDLVRWGALLQTPDSRPLHPIEHLRNIYLSRASARILFDSVFNVSSDHLNQAPYPLITASHVQVGHFFGSRANFSNLSRCGVAMGVALQQAGLVILTGPHGSGHPLHEVSVNNTTDTADILGSFEQVDSSARLTKLIRRLIDIVERRAQFTSALAELKIAADAGSTPSSSGSLATVLHFLDELPVDVNGSVHEQTDLSTSVAVGRFEWVDGPLVRALKAGHWLLLDGANLLNALCEPSGVLTLNERVIVPHPSFRLIMSVDSQHGELSRAMRNRGIEVYHVRLPRVSATATRLVDPMSHIEFELQRRGLFVTTADLEHQSVSSDLRLNEDSLSSSMMNLSSVMLCSETSSDVISHFTARSVTPAYVHRLSRFLAERYLLSGSLNGLRPLVDSMTHGGVWDKLRRLRQQFGLMWPLSPDLLHFQPMDFFMKSLSYSNSYPELDRTSVQYPILRALEIFVKTCVYDHSERLSIRSIGAETSASDISSRVSKGVEDVIVQIGRLATAMLESLPDVLSDDLSVEIGVMLRLQKISQLMRDVSPDAVDFSTIQAVTGWMHDDLHNAPVRFSDLSFSVEVLSRLVAPSSGLGLTNIWLTLSNPRHMTRPVDFLELEKASTRLRMEMLQMMALQSLPDSANNKEAIEQLVEEVKNWIERRCSLGAQGIGHHRPRSYHERAKILSGISTCTFVRSQTNEIFQDIERVIDLACQSPHVPLGRFVSYRHATWIMDADRFDLAALSPVHKSWFQSLWNLDSADGPSLLFQPTELYRTLLKGDWTDVTLASLDEYETELRRHSTLLMMYDASSSRTQSLIHMFRQALLILSFCFLDTFDEATRHEIVSSYAQPPDNPSHSLPDILEAIERTSHPQLALSVKRYLTAAVLQLDIHSSQPSIIGAIGQCWVALFHLFVDLYVPDTPLDPAAVQRCIWDFWTSERTSLMAQRKLHSQLEHRVTGNTVNGVVRYLDGQIQESAKHLDSFPEIAPGAKRSVLRLGQFWSEVSQFLTKVVAPSRLDPLINLLHLRDPSAPTREVVVQESISGFSQRLDSVYQDFSDMSIPLQSALLHLRLGLRLIGHASQCQHSESLDAKADVLVAFPSVRATGILLQIDSNDGGFGMGASAIDSLLLKLAAVAVEVDLGVDIRAHVHKIDVIYEQVTRLWLIDRSRQEEAEKSSQSLYRSSRVDNEAVKDSDVEEEEFLFLFPDFDGSLETEQDVGSSGQRSSTHLIEVPHVNRLADLHLRLLGTQDHATLGQEATAAFTHHRTSLLRAVLDEHLKALPESLDAKSFIHQFSLLHRRQLHLQQQAQSTSRPYSFYLDAHVPEIRKASALVGLIKHRLEGILREWPDQMVLHHLKDRCDQILRLNVHSPVAKVLTALEQLLLQSEDWEMYANRDNSLKDQRQSLTSLIVDWRRLELASWKGLLQTQLIAFEEDASEWWFRLYNAAVRGLLDVLAKEENSDDHDGVDIYLDSLVPLVDDYIQTSPIGQISRRMELLQSFGTLIRHLATTKTLRERDALQRVLRIFHNTHAYYTQFIARIAGSLSSQRNTVEKEIQGFTKLASWRDINVQALKASAQRTHRQLYRSIRKFREILRQPAKGLLQPEQASQSEVASVTVHAMPQQEEYAGGDDVDQFPNYAVCSDGPAHLQDLPRTYRRFDTLLTTRVENFIRSRPSHSVDDLSSEILSTAKALSNISLPSATTAERREKHWKSLLVRKRKAWSDLLKELKRVGYAANVKPDVLARQRSDRWMREQSMLFLPSPAFTEVPKIEHYFHRLQGLFPQLRAALSDHHADLSTRELQRGVMFLESGLSIALNARSRLASSFDSYQKLKDISQRLKSLRGLDQIAGRGPQALERASRVEGVLSRFSCALSETLEKLKILGELPSAPPTPFSVLQEVQAMLASSEGHRDRLRAVCLDLKRTSTPMLFQDEQAVLTAGEAFIVEASERLLVMADTQTHTEKIITSLQDWLVSEHLPGPTEPEILLSSTIDTDNTIDVLLVTVQSLLSVLPESEDLQQLSSQDNYIKSTSSTMSRLCDLLDIGAMAEKTDSAVEQLSLNTSRLLPFVERYTRLVEAHLSGLARWTLSLLKLEFVVCSVVNNPPDAEEAGKGEGGEAAEGMGKEIEDEREEGENNKEREKGADDDNAIEMGDDFEGDMEDESDEEGEEGPEEQIGDLDASDPSAVDEKLWGDEKGPETEAEESKTNEDRSTEAKQDSESGERKDQTERPDEDETLTEDPVDEPMPEDGPEAAGETAPDGEDANTLDLPDDLELAANEDEDMLSEEELQEGDEAEQRPGSSPEPMDDQADDLDPQAHQAEGGDEEAANGGDDAAEDAAAEPDLQPADASSKDAVPEESYNSNTREDAAGESGQAKGGVTGAAGQGDDAEHDDGGVQDVQREAGAPDDAEGRGSNAAGVQSGTAPSQESHQRELSSNPLRSLGDTLKEIRQRFDDILEADSSAEQPVPHAADVAEPSQLEYLRPDDVDQGMQALGPAGAEQVAKLSDLKLVDDQLEGEDADAMDVDKPEPPTPRMDPPQTTSLHAPDTAELLGEDVEGAIAQHQVKLQDALRGAYPTAESNVPKAEIDIDVPEDPEQVEAALRLWQSQGQPLEGAENIWRLYESLTHDLAYALCEQLRLILEPTLATRLKGDYRTGKRLNMKKIIPYIASEYTKDKIWLRRTRPSQREYQVLIALDDSRSMAESHSVHLAHQTLALVAKALSRLEVGDIAIAKFGAGVDVLHAFDGGAFTDQAGVRVMQAFGFDQRATNVLAMVEASLRILEEARERRALGSSSAADLWQLEIIISDGICQDHEKLRTVLRKAEEQRVMVVFIVIDSLHSSAAAAATNPATTAGPSAQNSILSMNQVAYKNVDGRMELQMQRYLDSFPFEYYVVLRNVEALPEVLSGTLKQFFERISDE
ncbi:hypothetical protein BV25DRAFT_1871299 [Artomyces pyxidatus]|uniref:Uncharacterized protein n=1 Tax=Artomyces pyxidatus TaxID=48021 RepID=A0ACB8SV29_9AGAM|nr:hypothetical protein BV25DRAFT_1871299 [Artomyces pyxidatus]